VMHDSQNNPKLYSYSYQTLPMRLIGYGCKLSNL
jgi:hypothetical protein